jgi:C4-type Zn-finger protein
VGLAVERELRVDAACPACGRKGLTLRTMTGQLPCFGSSLLTTVRCEARGFRHADTMVMERRAPSRHAPRFLAPADLAVRVARSDSGTY